MNKKSKKLLKSVVLLSTAGAFIGAAVGSVVVNAIVGSKRKSSNAFGRYSNGFGKSQEYDFGDYRYNNDFDNFDGEDDVDEIDDFEDEEITDDEIDKYFEENGNEDIWGSELDDEDMDFRKC